MKKIFFVLFISVLSLGFVHSAEECVQECNSDPEQEVIDGSLGEFIKNFSMTKFRKLIEKKGSIILEHSPFEDDSHSVIESKKIAYTVTKDAESCTTSPSGSALCKSFGAKSQRMLTINLKPYRCNIAIKLKKKGKTSDGSMTIELLFNNKAMSSDWIKSKDLIKIGKRELVLLVDGDENHEVNLQIDFDNDSNSILFARLESNKPGKEFKLSSTYGYFTNRLEKILNNFSRYVGE